MPDVRLPSGIVVRASSLAERQTIDHQRDFGLYLDAAWKPDWPSCTIAWPDFGLPSYPVQAFRQITDAYRCARSGKRLEIGCRGGLGRTGTVLACFAVIEGLAPLDAVDWVRTSYDRHAIETPDQERWVGWFASQWAERGSNT